MKNLQTLCAQVVCQNPMAGVNTAQLFNGPENVVAPFEQPEPIETFAQKLLSKLEVAWKVQREVPGSKYLFEDLYKFEKKAVGRIRLAFLAHNRTIEAWKSVNYIGVFSADPNSHQNNIQPSASVPKEH